MTCHKQEARQTLGSCEMLPEDNRSPEHVGRARADGIKTSAVETYSLVPINGCGLARTTKGLYRSHTLIRTG